MVLASKRTAMCLFPEGGVDSGELVEAADVDEEVSTNRKLLRSGQAWSRGVLLS